MHNLVHIASVRPARHARNYADIIFSFVLETCLTRCASAKSWSHPHDLYFNLRTLTGGLNYPQATSLAKAPELVKIKGCGCMTFSVNDCFAL
jgi:hypothetical protein